MARVVLTQPWPRARVLADRLRGLGHEALALPLSRIVELGGEPAVRDRLSRLDRYDWIVLVSPTAIDVAARTPGVTWPSTTGFAVVGPGSLQAIADSGLPVEPARVLMPDGPPFDADALVATPPLDAPRGLRILVLRGEGGSEGWIARLRAGGAAVETCELYRREPLDPPQDALAALRAMLGSAPAPVFVFTQVEAVARIETLLARAGLSAPAHAVPALAIHSRIVAALRGAGWRVVRAIEPGERALAAALEWAPDSPSSHGV